jgi:hypothetical protein
MVDRISATKREGIGSKIGADNKGIAQVKRERCIHRPEVYTYRPSTGGNDI